MSNIVPFESAALPAFVQRANAVGLNDDLTAHAGTGFPVMSIKGKVFAIARSGEREVLMNPKDPESPATHIDVVLLKASPHKTKQFYLGQWTEGQEASKPDCWSNDGIRPDATVENKQSPSCATCKHNQWETKVGQQGATKGKACADSIRVAIATPQQLNEPYLLRVPPASIKPLGEYGETLKKRGVGYNMVVTRISFELETPTPKLVFKPIGFLDEKAYDEVTDVVNSEVMRKIMGVVTAYDALPAPVAPVEPVAVAAPAQSIVKQAEAVVAKAAAAPKPAAKKQAFFAEAEVAPAPAAKTKEVTEAEIVAAVGGAKPAAEVVVDMEGLDLSSLNFDD